MGRHVSPSQMAKVFEVTAVLEKLKELGIISINLPGNPATVTNVVEAEDDQDDNGVGSQDAELIGLAVASETNFTEMMSQILRRRLHEETLVKASKAAEEALAKRRKAREARVARLDDMIGWLLAQSGLPSLDTVYGKVLPRRLPVGIEIPEANEGLIPSRYLIEQDPVIDKAQVRKDVQTRVTALANASKIDDEAKRAAAIAEVNVLYPEIPGVIVHDDRRSFQIR